MAEEVSVASTVYNLAGEESERPDYIKVVLFQNIITHSKQTIAEYTVKSQLKGPAINLRNFFRWADNNYGVIGMPTGNLAGGFTTSLAVLNTQIPVTPPNTISTQTADVAGSDFTQWAHQYILANYPAEYGTAYVMEIDPLTTIITITLDDGITQYSFTPTDFITTANYIYATYYDSSAPTALKMFIYRVGSGNAILDASVVPIAAYGKFFPYIPLRLNNTFLSDTYLPTKYELAKKAFKKSIGGDYDAVIDQIAENESIDDIDYAYTVFGVSLNVLENSCKKYIYRFLEKLMDTQVGGKTLYTDWLCKNAGAVSAPTALAIWAAAQSNPADPLYGTPQPNSTFVSVFPARNNILKVTDGDNLDLRIEWTWISTAAGVGLGKPGAKVGDLWFAAMTTNDAFSAAMTGTGGNKDFKKRINLYWQNAAGSYLIMYITGFIHHNYIYKSYSVRNSAYDIINTLGTGEDYEESGFLIPLHYGTFREMPLTDATQMSTACAFLVFNAYEAVEIPWWQSGIFQIFLIVVIAIVAAVFTGGAGLGILGANLAVGSALGLTGLTAAIVGSVVNALAAVALTAIITQGAIALFGQDIGQLIGLVVGFFVMQGLTSFNTTGNLAFSFSELLKVDNIMLLMDAVGKGYTAMVNSDIAAMAEELKTYIQQAEEQLSEVKAQYESEFGTGIGYIDPLIFTSTRKLIIEKSDTFLTRTLMTGSDIAEISLSMINDFTDLTLALPKAYT